MAAQGAFGIDFYGRSTRTIVGTMLWTEYRPVIKIGPKGALGNHEIRPIHSAPSLGQSIMVFDTNLAIPSSVPTYRGFIEKGEREYIRMRKSDSQPGRKVAGTITYDP